MDGNDFGSDGFLEDLADFGLPLAGAFAFLEEEARDEAERLAGLQAILEPVQGPAKAMVPTDRARKGATGRAGGRRRNREGY